MRLQHESIVYIVNLYRVIVANYSRTSLRLSHPSEIGALVYVCEFCDKLLQFSYQALAELIEGLNVQCRVLCFILQNKKGTFSCSFL